LILSDKKVRFFDKSNALMVLLFLESIFYNGIALALKI
jgi:hypothetical protein